jgi:hypothetical protein
VYVFVGKVLCFGAIGSHGICVQRTMDVVNWTRVDRIGGVQGRRVCFLRVCLVVRGRGPV